MKSLFIVLCIFIISVFSQCRIHKSNEPIITVKVTDIRKAEKPKIFHYENGISYSEKAKGNFYKAHIDLINNTDTVVCFWSETCGWPFYFVFNKPNIRIFFLGCDYNNTILRSILPNQEYSYDATIQLMDTLNSEENNGYRLGFLLYKRDEVDKNGLFLIPPPPNSNYEPKCDTFWSDTLNLCK